MATTAWMQTAAMTSHTTGRSASALHSQTLQHTETASWGGMHDQQQHYAYSQPAAEHVESAGGWDDIEVEEAVPWRSPVMSKQGMSNEK